MNGSKAMEYQQKIDEREHQKAEWEQEDLEDEGIHVPIKDICNCSRCLSERWAEAERR